LKMKKGLHVGAGTEALGTNRRGEGGEVQEGKYWGRGWCKELQPMAGIEKGVQKQIRSTNNKAERRYPWRLKSGGRGSE